METESKNRQHLSLIRCGPSEAYRAVSSNAHSRPGGLSSRSLLIRKPYFISLNNSPPPRLLSSSPSKLLNSRNSGIVGGGGPRGTARCCCCRSSAASKSLATDMPLRRRPLWNQPALFLRLRLCGDVGEASGEGGRDDRIESEDARTAPFCACRSGRELLLLRRLRSLRTLDMRRFGGGEWVGWTDGFEEAVGFSAGAVVGPSPLGTGVVGCESRGPRPGVGGRGGVSGGAGMAVPSVRENWMGVMDSGWNSLASDMFAAGSEGCACGFRARVIASTRNSRIVDFICREASCGQGIVKLS